MGEYPIISFRMFYSILGFYPLDTSGTYLLICDNQKCIKGVKFLLIENFCFFCFVFNLKWKNLSQFSGTEKNRMGKTEDASEDKET